MKFVIFTVLSVLGVIFAFAAYPRFANDALRAMQTAFESDTAQAVGTTPAPIAMPYEDAKSYYLTQAEMSVLQNAIDRAVQSGNYSSIAVNGHLIKISYNESGPICPYSGRPERLDVQITKPVRLVKDDRTL